MRVPQRGGATMAISVTGAHFPQDLIRMGVRWYLTSPLRYRHGEARMTECGVRLDHATIQRGVVQEVPWWKRRGIVARGRWWGSRRLKPHRPPSLASNVYLLYLSA